MSTVYKTTTITGLFEIMEDSRFKVGIVCSFLLNHGASLARRGKSQVIWICMT